MFDYNYGRYVRLVNPINNIYVQLHMLEAWHNRHLISNMYVLVIAIKGVLGWLTWSMTCMFGYNY